MYILFIIELGDFMLCIKENSIYEQVINKSRFITLLFKIDNLDDVQKYLDFAKNEYPGATHYTYAFILDGINKMSDDGEPSKTAGSPILNVLAMKNLDHILCIVVRFFGGIKLGAGGLVRAYSSSCSKALEENTIIELKKGFKIRIIVNYDESNKINYILSNSKIIYKEFSDKVIYEALVLPDILNQLENFSPEVLEEVFINN